MKKYFLAILLIGGIAAPAAIMAGSSVIAPDATQKSAGHNVITDSELQAATREVPLIIPAGSVERVLGN